MPSGATFVARRAEEGREFLASTDSWFRPVFLYIGPDGALYVVDYYRARIEHPEWTSSDLQKNPAPLYEGQNRGRIYRISRDGMKPGAPPALGRADTATLVSALEKDSLWWRRTAQRLLLDRHPQDAVPLLTKLATSSSSPFGRLHALWTLDGLGALDDAADLRRAGRHGGRRPRECDSAGRVAAERLARVGLGAARHDRRLRSARAVQCARGARISRFAAGRRCA